MNLSRPLIGVVRFLGSNCDQDAYRALRELGIRSEYVWFTETKLDCYDGLFLPGGFSWGDYLRPGAIAAIQPIIEPLRDFVAAGKPVLGICNGFQILCEAQILPGVLQRNVSDMFVCKEVWLKPVNTSSLWTRGLDRPFRIDIAHGDGRFIDTKPSIKLRRDSALAFQYCDQEGCVTASANPNGSQLGIAGVLNEAGNVLGMMPHPERGVNPSLRDPLCAQLLRNGFAA
jgi:phosphoribosylformylglycinamidine synthase